MSHSIASLLNKRKNPLHLPPKERTRQNLEYVVEHLPILADLMPEIRRDFTMNIYGCYNTDVHACGTAGCLLGNIARLFELKPYLVGRRFSYRIYSWEVFPLIVTAPYTDTWSFLFDPRWQHYQPTFQQGIERINHLLACDLEIEYFRFDKNIITYKHTQSSPTNPHNHEPQHRIITE